MKKIVALCLPLIFLMPNTGCMKQNKKVIFFGDSITQLGVNPGGYIDVMNKQLEVKNESKDFELIGSGISGNKVYDLYLRLEEDVLAKNPDIVVIWVGVNDVWHKTTLGTGTDADKFEIFYIAVIKKLQAKGIKVILTTPAAIGEKNDNTNPQDDELNLYADIIRNLAAQYKCGLCDLRKIVLAYETTNNKENLLTGVLTNDGVHLNAKGNELVAVSMLEVLDK